MQPEDCGPRLQELGTQLRDLHARDAELELAMSDPRGARDHRRKDHGDLQRDRPDNQDWVASPEEGPRQAADRPGRDRRQCR